MKLVHRAQYEISIDGVPRSYRDRQDIAIQTARFLKSRNPHSVVKLKDLQTGEETVVAFKSEQECLSSCARPALVLGVYKDLPDYGVFCGEWCIGRIYKTRTVLNCAGSGRCMLPASQAK